MGRSTVLMKSGCRWMSVGLLAIATISCGSPAPTSTESATDSDATETVEQTTETASAEDQQSAAPQTDSASEPDLQAIFGTVQDGWLPTLLAEKQLVHTMGPEEVGKIYPGAENLSGTEGDEFRLSESAASDVPGVQGYKFSFQNDTLYSVTIIFDPKLNGDEFFQELTDVTIEKYGEVEPDQIADKYLIWVGPGFASATLSEGFSEFEGNEFNIVLPD